MAAIMLALRAAPWLGAQRASAWAGILAALSIISALSLIGLTHGGGIPDPWGRPLAADFSSFWTAGGLALQGLPASAWDPAAHAAAQIASFRPDAGYGTDYYAFFYPPPYLLICLPLALLPYGPALAVWILATGTAYFVVMRSLLPRTWPAALAALAFPAVLLNAGNGQNGALSTALMGTAALQLDRRPRAAGACLGALCFKPQLALLVVPALIAARRWRSLAWAAGTAGALCLASLLIFGETAWQAFLANTALARAALEAGLVGFPKMVSTFAAMRQLGAAPSLAWAVQCLASLTALATVLSVSHRKPGAGAEGATMAAAACLASPFLLDYDLMLLAIPLAWVAARAERGGYLPWEKLILLAAFVLPLVVRQLAILAGVPLAPLVVAALLAVVVRRALLAPAAPGFGA